MMSIIQHSVRLADSLIARTYLSMFQERGGLLAFLFHSLFRDEREIALNQVDPLQRTTIAQFREFIEYYLEKGYRFVGPEEILGGLDRSGRHALITFDDGYANNALALPILEEYGVPATIFVSTDHVRKNKCFWWDVLYRERLAEGASYRRIYAEGQSLKGLTTETIETRLKQRFGADAFQPRGEIDRPFTPAELRAIARSPYIHIGNHTVNHAILTNYSHEQARAQIENAQSALAEMTGSRPTAIAYPNGDHASDVMRTCLDLGLKVGFTVRPFKNVNPVAAPSLELLRLGRFCLHDELPIETQCRTCRSDILLYGILRGCYLLVRHSKAWELAVDESAAACDQML
jgi:peptidoglycan/xylan/chitin deacetylase (PgdA/CDA1 family)